MELIELLPTLHLLRFDVGNAYLWHEGDALTLIDAGVPGSGAEIKAAVEGLGFTLGHLRAVVVTHGHDDHWGALSELGDDAPFLVHAADAPVLRGDYRQRVPDRADLPDWERELFDGLPPIPAPSPARVDRELADGDVLDFGGGAHVIGIPGHTPGSIAIHVPAHRLLFAGDTIANVGDHPMLGVFNIDRQGAADSFRRLSELDLSLVCVGHGDPVTGDASARLRQVKI
ncbi:MBL fold metallo-hydrolase [Nonomuraea zeae]|uniref:MBL fold metallo-hydrolase n=1 Tax=Nonomuraea zeae TaxID=1642303 RepID=A0A5S4GGS9_9ACTN|nr:MBL fold metallo-hydrolase [Nonomuraea zeae]TMR32168.1 MBL fold metallo-hydrolase [Nonomuraea zeae]